MAGMGDTVNVTPTLDASGNVIPVTATQTQPIPSTEVTSKQLTPEQLAALQAEQAANADVNSAAMPSPPLDTRTPADIAADVASQEQSAKPAQMLADAGLTPVPAGQPNANLPYSSQQFDASTEGNGLVGGIKGPQTVQQATDENAAYQAQAQARVARETEAQQQAIEAARQQRLDAGMQRLNQAAADYEQKSKLTSYKDDHSLFHNILSGLAVGMGAFGAAQTHSPNFALEILNKEMDQDMERKKLAMESAFNNYKQAGMAPEQINAWAKQQQENLLARQQAQLNTVQTLGARTLAPFPQAQQAFLQAAAERKAKQAKDALDFMKDATGFSKQTSDIGEKQTTTTGKENRGDVAERVTGVQKAALIKVQGEHAARLEKLLDESPQNFPSPDQIRKIQDNTNRLTQRQGLEEHSALQSLFGQALRGVGAVPSSVFEGADMTDKQKEAWTLHVLGAHTQSINEAGTGFLSNDVSRDAIFSPRVAQPNDPADLNIEKARNGIQFAKTAAQMVDDVSKPGQQEKKIEQRKDYTATTAQQIIADKGARGLDANDKAALSWAKANPRAPQARAITLKIAQKLAGAR